MPCLGSRNVQSTPEVSGKWRVGALGRRARGWGEDGLIGPVADTGWPPWIVLGRWADVAGLFSIESRFGGGLVS